MANKILVVDDEPDIRAELREYLTHKGFEVVEAANGLEGFERFLSASPDAVITDVKMPGRAGDVLVRQLRGMGAHLPIIAITGIRGQFNLTGWRLPGADATMCKPIILSELANMLNTMLEIDSLCARA